MKRIDNIGFVGGNACTFEFDFGTKVAGSVVECPIRLFFGAVDPAAIQSPVNANGTVDTTNWVERTTQAEYDNVKTQDNNATHLGTAVNGKSGAALAELDLTPLCNALYGGSNSALKAALKSIQVDAWASGSGSNNGVAANGCSLKTWANSNVWFAPNPTGNPNTTGNISKMSVALTDQAGSAYYINSSNKLYILVVVTYTSNVTIASTVNLDYLKFTIQFSRVPDALSPIPIELPKYWAIAGSISPCWDNTNTILKRFFTLYSTDYNRWSFYFLNGAFGFQKRKNDVVTTLSSSTATFSRNIVYKFIVGQDVNGMFLYLLKNNGTVEKYRNTNNDILNGDFSLYTMMYKIGDQADAIAEYLALIDLEKINKSNGFTDQEAQVILQGRNIIDTLDSNLNNLAEEYENPNLFDVNNLANTTYATINGDTVVLTPTVYGTPQAPYIYIPVLPNNKYRLRGNINATNSAIVTTEIYNGIIVKSNACVLDGTGLDKTFITSSKTNKVKIYLYPVNTNVQTFSDIYFARED